MSLSPNSSEASFASEKPSTKFSLNINAFNGHSAPKSLPLPIQPKTNPTFSGLLTNIPPGMVRPM